MGPQLPAQEQGSPIVSVVVPTYNRMKYIRDALDSVLHQTFSSFEVIVVDDGSTDGTGEVLRPYLDRIRYIHQENRGAAAARNAGIRNARGTCISFMDSDDLATPYHLESLYNFLSQNLDYAMVVGNGAYFEGRFHNRRTLIPLSTAQRLEERGVSVADLFDGRVVRLQGTMVRKSALGEIGLLDEWFRLSYDLDLALRLIKSHRIGFINRVIYLYRKHADNISADDELRSRENLRALEKLSSNYPEALELIGRRTFFNLVAHRYYRLAKALEKKGDRRGARKAIREAISRCPLRLKYRLYQLRWA
jgi:glycosyltransferase involved in cell wall biosynthesis